MTNDRFYAFVLRCTFVKNERRKDGLVFWWFFLTKRERERPVAGGCASLTVIAFLPLSLIRLPCIVHDSSVFVPFTKTTLAV